MNKSKIQWEGWGQFDDMTDFMSFVRDNSYLNVPYQINEMLWPTTNCAIVIWLN